MEVNQISLKHFIHGLREAGLNPAEIIPEETLKNSRALGFSRLMVERGAHGDGQIKIPIVRLQDKKLARVGTRVLSSFGYRVDSYWDPKLVTRVHSPLSIQRAKAVILGSFGVSELGMGIRNASPEAVRLGFGIQAYWMQREFDSLADDLDIIQEGAQRCPEILAHRPGACLKADWGKEIDQVVSRMQALENMIQGFETTFPFLTRIIAKVSAS